MFELLDGEEISDLDGEFSSARRGNDSSLSPLRAERKLRMACPKPLATWGRRFPPNSTNMMAKIMVNSQAPSPNILNSEEDLFLAQLPYSMLKKSQPSYFYGHRAAVKLARRLLWQVGIESSHLDAQILLEAVLKKDRLELMVGDELELNQEQLERFWSLVRRRLCYEPIAYLTSTKEFYGHEFHVSKDCLIPRPDTECVVEKCLSLLTDTSGGLVIDMCTGSGAIGLTILSQRPNLTVIGSDISLGALKIAEKNADALKVSQRFIGKHGDLFLALDASDVAQMIVANPPYIAKNALDSLPSDVGKYEPRIALDGGDEMGISFYRRILDGAASHLHDGGYLIFEIGFDQAELVVSLLPNGFKMVEIFKDLSGHDRGVVFKKP